MIRTLLTTLTLLALLTLVTCQVFAANVELGWQTAQNISVSQVPRHQIWVRELPGATSTKQAYEFSCVSDGTTPVCLQVGRWASGQGATTARIRLFWKVLVNGVLQTRSLTVGTTYVDTRGYVEVVDVTQTSQGPTFWLTWPEKGLSGAVITDDFSPTVPGWRGVIRWKLGSNVPVPVAPFAGAYLIPYPGPLPSSWARISTTPTPAGYQQTGNAWNWIVTTP